MKKSKSKVILCIAICSIMFFSGMLNAVPDISANALTLSIGVNASTTINIAANSYVIFNLNLMDANEYRQIMEYVFSVDSFNSKVQLFRDGVLVKECLLGVYFTPQTTGNYTVRLSSLNGAALTGCTVRFYTEEEVYFYSRCNNPLYNSENNINQAKPYLNSMNYYLNHLTNSESLEFNMNHRYFMVACPGNESGTLNTGIGYDMQLSDIPDMSDNYIAVFSADYSGLPGHSAYTSAINGSNYTMGWPGKITLSRSRYFTTRFWFYVSNGISPASAKEYARQDLINYYWYVIFWGSDTIRQPISYENFSLSLSSYSAAESDTFKDYKLISKDEATSEINSIKYNILKNKNITRYIQTIDGCLTNDFILYDSTTDNYYKSSINISSEDESEIIRKGMYEYNIDDILSKNYSEYNNFKEIVSESYYVKSEKEMTKIKRVQVECNDKNNVAYLKEIYYNVNNGIELSEDSVAELFNN